MPGSRPIHRLPSLDGMRGIGFLCVFLTHAHLPHWPVPGDPALAVFFVLSGYLITTLIRQEYDRSGSVNIPAFYARRALRLLPPFSLVMVIAVIVARLVYLPGTVHPAPIIAVALNMTNYWLALFGGPGMAPGIERYWSLAVEEHFYLLYPLLYLTLRRSGLSGAAQARVLWALCGLALLWRCVLVAGFHAPDNYITLATETRGDMILYGCALGAWANPVLDPVRLSEATWKWRIIPLCLAAMALSMVWHNRLFHLTWYYTLQGVALTGLVSAAVRFPGWMLFRWLNWRPLSFMGVLSYTLYLIHDVNLRALAWLWPHWPLALRVLTAFLLSMMVAVAMNALVERPCARLRTRLRRRTAGGEIRPPEHPLAPALR